MTNITNRPGYIEAFTANSGEVAKFEPEQPQFHWNVVNMIRRFIKDSEGEAKGWRRQVTTLIAEKSWLKLGYNSLPELLEEALGMTADDFLHEVEVYGGPDLVDIVSPHLGAYTCNKYKNAADKAARSHEQRQAANAPEIAVRLRASDLITEADMRHLGKLNADDAHQETLQLIEDRLEELWEREGVTPRDRRKFRGQVKGIIQAVAPKPEPQKQSKVLRFPDDAERALAIIQEHLSESEQVKLRQMICDGIEPPPKTARKKRPSETLPTQEEALEAVLSLADGEFTTARNVMVLIGDTGTNPGNFSTRYREGGEVSGNGWKFKKHTADEMIAKGFHGKAPSWEVIEYGQD